MRFPLALLASAAMISCTAVSSGTDAVPELPDATPAGAVSDHIVLVSIDGLRPDAIAAFGATTLQRLMGDGSYTLAATTIHPSKTLPSHASMLTGEDVDEHGILWNTNQVRTRGHVAVPTIFEVATASGFRTAAFFSKSKFEHLQRHGTLHYTQAPPVDWLPFIAESWPATRTVADTERYLAHHRPNLLFVHLREPDHAGHRHGWMTRRYGDAVRAADVAVARLVAAADGAFGAGRWTLLVTADHGGHGRGHGTRDARDVTIPWIAWGKGVRAGGRRITGPVRTFDTASTVLWLLGLEEPADWTGTPVTHAFAAPAPAGAARPGGS